MNLNKVYLLGTLTREPESRDTHSGSTVVRVVVSVSRDYFSKERNQRVRETDSIEVQAWGQLGNQLVGQAHKGSSLFVEGRLKVDSWETPGGERRQRLVVHLENFAVLTPGQRMPQAAAAAAAGGAAVIGGEESGEGPVEEGGESAGAPGASGRRKRRRRRGPRRDGIPAAPPAPVTPEDRASFTAGLEQPAGTAPAPAPEAPAPATAAPAPAAAAPAPPPPPPPPSAPAPERKPVPNTSLKEDMPF